MVPERMALPHLRSAWAVEKTSNSVFCAIFDYQVLLKARQRWTGLCDIPDKSFPLMKPVNKMTFV